MGDAGPASAASEASRSSQQIVAHVLASDSDDESYAPSCTDKSNKSTESGEDDSGMSHSHGIEDMPGPAAMKTNSTTS